MHLSCGVAAERALQPALRMGRNVPETGEFNASVRTRQVEVRNRKAGVGRDVTADHRLLKGLAAGQVANIHKAVDEAIIDPVFRRCRNSRK
ncbi:hypothetical protein D3C87_1508110 [compost metagenome]